MAAAVATTVTGTISDMAIPNEVDVVSGSNSPFFGSSAACLLGLGAVAWGGLALPLFWQQEPVNRVVSGVLQGRAYKMQRRKKLMRLGLLHFVIQSRCVMQLFCVWSFWTKRLQRPTRRSSMPLTAPYII